MRRAAATLLAILLALALAACTGGDGGLDAFDAGPGEDFPAGSVTTFADGEIVERATPTESTGDHLFGGEVVFHLVRRESGGFLALSARDAHSQCWVPWSPEHEFDGQTGWFFDFCHGNTYDGTGTLVFGPGPRDLDRYPVEIRDGRVYVTLAEDALILGATAEASAPGATPTPASTSPTATCSAAIDWVDFIQLGGIQYLSTPATIDEADLGPQLATVRFKVSDNVCDPSYRAKSGDAAFLDAGTPLYIVGGYAPEFRLAARRAGRLLLYEAVTNPAATAGGDLLDIGGRVTYIGVNSPTDATTELAAIDDADEVAALVDLVLDAPVDQGNRDHDGPRYFIAFHLDDGTEVIRSYWPGSGELHRGIMLPPEFAEMVDRALTAAPETDRRSTTSD